MPTAYADAPIFLIGFMASGKTTVGRLLAEHLDWAFVDLDKLIEEGAGRTVADIFAAEGEAGFRKRETEAVLAAAKRRKTVVATGGGAPCREESISAMLAAGRVYWLDVSPDEAVRRAGKNSGRPLLDGAAEPVPAARKLLDARRPFYERAHERIETDGHSAEGIVDHIVKSVATLSQALRLLEMNREELKKMVREVMLGIVRVELGDRSYDVSIGAFSPDDIADKLAAALDPKTTGVAVLIDTQVAERSGRARELVAALGKRLPHVERLELRPGEACKNLTEIEKSCEWLAAHGYDRRAAVVGIGGGAATDHAGFVAAVYLRGVPFALVPTTLLAMVDASVGGKTGVDLGAGKNLVGAFHQPRAVVADVGFLETLPARERIAGLAEVVKCGFIVDAGLLDLLEQSGPDLGVEAHQEIIRRAVHVKADVVASDETESGRRAILNFGHTVGHALEAASGYGLLHGEAVALGMVAALDLGAALGIGAPALADRARRLLAGLGLPVDYERRFDAQAQAGLTVDKKRRGSTIRFVFVPTPGETRLEEIAPADITSHLSKRSGAKA